MARRKKENPRQMIDGIRKTKDLKRWEAAVFTGQYDEDNKPIYKWVTGDTEKEVKEKRDELKYRINNNIYVNPTDITLGEYLDEWLEIHKTNIAETTYELYRMYIRKHIKPILGDYKLNKIIPMTLQMFYNKKLQPEPDKKLKDGTIKKGKALKSKTVRKFHILLHEALENAKKNNLILNNPASNVNPPKIEKYMPRILSIEDYFKLVDAVKGTYDEIYIVLAGGLGLRRGEVMGLCWEDIDFKNKTITIRQSITRFTKDIVKTPKNDSSFRTIAVPDYILNILQEYRNKNKVVKLDKYKKNKENKNDDGLENRICNKYKPQSYSKHFKDLLKKHNIPSVRYHDLRHFTAIIMMMKGIPDKVVAEILGHAQVSTTREIYQHVIDEMRRSAAKTMDDFFISRQ